MVRKRTGRVCAPTTTGESDPLLIHYMHFRTIAHATEDKSRVLKALDFFLSNCFHSPDNAKSAALPEILSATGHFGNPIHIMTAKIEKKGDCNRFVNFFNANVTDEDRQALRSRMPEYLDDDLNFYMRFDKQEAYAGRLRLTDSDNAVFFRVKIETYPKSWEKAGMIVEELFG